MTRVNVFDMVNHYSVSEREGSICQIKLQNHVFIDIV